MVEATEDKREGNFNICLIWRR